jgi:hypothetical protein
MPEGRGSINLDSNVELDKRRGFLSHDHAVEWCSQGSKK